MVAGKAARVCRGCLKPIKVGESYVRINGRKTHAHCVGRVKEMSDDTN